VEFRDPLGAAAKHSCRACGPPLLRIAPLFLPNGASVNMRPPSAARMFAAAPRVADRHQLSSRKHAVFAAEIFQWFVLGGWNANSAGIHEKVARRLPRRAARTPARAGHTLPRPTYASASRNLFIAASWCSATSASSTKHRRREKLAPPRSVAAKVWGAPHRPCKNGRAGVASGGCACVADRKGIAQQVGLFWGGLRACWL